MSQKIGFKYKGIGVIAAILVLIVAFFSKISDYLIDYQWFSELNYQEVFFKKLLTQIQFFVPTFIILMILFYLYMRALNAYSVKKSGLIPSNQDKKFKNKIFFYLSLVISFTFTMVFVADIWYDFLIFMNKTGFGISDPVFGKDIGYYIFTLPFLNKLYGYLMGLLIILGLLAVVYNVLMFFMTKEPDAIDEYNNVRSFYTPQDIYKNIFGAASKQLMVLGGIFFLLMAFGFYLRTFDLLYSRRGVAYGASFTDIFINLPSYYVYIVICVITAILLFAARSLKKARLAILGPVLLIVAIIGSGLIAAGVQSIIVAPNELAKEEIYLQNNINYTNFAYGLDKVAVKEFGVKQDLTRADLEKNNVTIGNIPINDYRPAKEIYNQIQGLKNYYKFNDIDIDRYMIDNTYRQVFISPRELQASNIPQQTVQGASWINRYMKFTHGYGIAMSPVNEVTASGQPRLFVGDMPVISQVGIKLDRPQIYFGELSKDFAIVNTREKEFDYPSTSGNVETVYTGTGGIKLNLMNRLMLAVREGQMNFLLSQDINSQSRILLNREITGRAKKLAPFLLFDQDPYIVTSEGKLYWIIDAYTYSSRYPYSESINEQTSTNYIRNSVKVVIDAYNGTTNFYIADANDPLIRAYASIFKTLFKPLNTLSSDLSAHIRYPQMLFDIQANIYRKYHMKKASDLYNKSDVWDVATQVYGATGQNAEASRGNDEVESSYLIMRLPDSDKEEFLLMVPYTPQGKTNMISWLGVKNDGANYGQLIQYNFPSGKIVEGPMQVEGIVSQDTIIGPQLNLLATGGNSEVVRGNMLIVPIEDSILYVEPIYVRAKNANALPEVKKVIVFYKNQVVMEDTLEAALQRIFPPTKPNVPQAPPAGEPTKPTAPSGTPGVNIGPIQDLIQKANTVFLDAQNALKTGNWTEYGNKMAQLQEILKSLSGAGAPKPSNQP